MYGEYDGNDGHEIWEDPDEFGRFLDSQGPWELRRAIERLDVHIATNPKDADALVARGLLHRELEDDRGADEDFSRAADLFPRNAGAHQHGRLRCIDLAQFHGSIEDLHRADVVFNSSDPPVARQTDGAVRLSKSNGAGT